MIGELLAEGAHGAVFAAAQPALGRDVAIKVVRKDRADDADFVRRFEAEAQLVARLEHPSIVPLYDYWREPGGAFLVFRLLRGGSLHDLLARGDRLPVSQIDEIVERVGDALATAHRVGVVHRDVRPANVLFDEDRHPYLADFGIAVEHSDDAAALDDMVGLAETASQLLGRLDPVDAADVEQRRSVLRRATSGEIESIAALLGEWRLARGATPSPTPTPDRPRHRRNAGLVVNPYKGLRPFTEAERGEFGGRSSACEQLAARTNAQSFVAVVGPSGSGKSSLVLAGLVPQLRESGFLVTTMIPGVRPMWSLAMALRRVTTEEQAGDAGNDNPASLLRSLAVERPLLLVVDQFEELWTVAVAADRDEFSRAVDRALDESGSLLRVVATVRADFYDRPLADPLWGPRFRDGSYPLAPLTAAELERAILGPLADSNVGVEPGLVAQIVADVGAQAGALPLVQFTLSTLFDARDSDLLTNQAYAALGGVVGAVASQAECLHQQLSPDDQAQIRRLFEALVTPGDGVEDTRRRASFAEVATVPAEVIEHVASARLVIFDRDPATGEPTVEIAHEALIAHWPRLRSWIETSRVELHARHQIRDAAAAWIRSEADPSHLYRGARLAMAIERVEPDRLGLTEQAFLETSIAARDREHTGERRRLRRAHTLLAATAGLLVVALVAGATALDQRANARDNATAAETNAAEARDNATAATANAQLATAARIDADLRRLALEARSVAPGQPDLGRLLAVEVAQRRPGTESDSAVLATLQADPLIDRVIDLGLREDGRIQDIAGESPGPIVVATAAEVVVVDGKTLVPTRVRWLVDDVATVAVSPDGREAASVSRKGHVERWNLDTGERSGVVLDVEPGAYLGVATPLAYLADGSLAVGNGATIEIYPRGASTQGRTLGLGHPVALLRSSPDGHLLVVSESAGSPGASTLLVDVENGIFKPLGPPSVAVAFGRDGTIYAAVFDARLRVVAYDATTANATAESKAGQTIASRLIPFPDGTVLRASVAGDLEILSPDLQSSRSVSNVSSVATIKVATVLSDARVLGASGARLVVVDLEAQPLPVTTLPLVGTVFPERIRDRFLLSGPDGARLYDAGTLQVVGPAIAPLANLTRGKIDLSPDATLVAGLVGAQMLVYETATGRRVGPPLSTQAQVGFVQFSPDGTRLAVTNPTGLAVYAVRDFALVREIPIRVTIANTLMWSPDSTELFFGDLTTYGHRIDLGSGLVTALGANFAAFSNDGARLATFAAGEPIRIFSRTTGLLDDTLTGFRENGWGRYLPGDRRMFRIAVGPYYDVIDMSTGSRIGEPFRLGDSRPAILSTPVGLGADGTYVLIGAAGNPVKRIELDPRRWLEMACEAAGRNLTRAEWNRYFATIADYDVTCPQYPPGN